MKSRACDLLSTVTSWCYDYLFKIPASQPGMVAHARGRWTSEFQPSLVCIESPCLKQQKTNKKNSSTSQECQYGNKTKTSPKVFQINQELIFASSRLLFFIGYTVLQVSVVPSANLSAQSINLLFWLDKPKCQWKRRGP